MWFFRKKSNEGLRRVDAVVTGLIVGSAIAAVYGLKRRRGSSAPAPRPEGGLLSRIVSFFQKRP
jgi:hypothetical protein